jgi:hypothetical protein
VFLGDLYQKTNYYTNNTRIKIENGEVLVWNVESFLKSMLIKESGFACSVSSEPAVLVITDTDSRITCFINEEVAKIVELIHITIADGYRALAYILLSKIQA